jgi:thioredoxin-dependent peroxiredoxin
VNGAPRLKPGDRAPDFELKDGDGLTWKLSGIGERVIVYFYPADETPGCTLEACDFRDSRDDLAHAGYTVLGISPQDAASHRAFATNHGLNFPLLVDDRLEAAKAYGAVRDVEGSYEGKPLKVARSTFVIDDRGVIVEAIYGVKAKGHLQDLESRLGI